MPDSTKPPHCPRIPLSGTPNFRDFGGYRNRTGLRVKRGALFRSGHLSALTTADLAAVAALDIRLVFDFREEPERQREPSQFPPGAEPNVVHLPIGPGRTLNLNVLDSPVGLTIDSEDVVDFMCQVNRELVEGYSSQYRQMFDHILNASGGATLIHCSAGKDRTGFAAAMILSALGVDEVDVIRDYLLSALYFNIDSELTAICRRLNWQGDMHVIRPVLEVREQYLRTAFDAISENYSDLSDYLREELGVDQVAREALQARFLER